MGYRLLARPSGRAHVRMPAPQYCAVVAGAAGEISGIRGAGSTAVDDCQLFLSVVAVVCDTRGGEPHVDRAAVRQRRQQLAAYQRRLFRVLRPSRPGADERSIRTIAAVGTVLR